MSLIHLALLAKAIEEQQKSTGAKRSTKKENSKSDYHYESDNTVGIETFLEDLLEKDPAATKLFLLLKDCQKEIDKEDHQKALEEVQRICTEYEVQDELLQKEIKNLENLGITLDKSIAIEKYYRPVKKSKEGLGFGGYGIYGYNPARYCMGFNGMPLTREMLENNINQFQIDLDKFNEENPNLDEQLQEVTALITKQKRSLKYSPFNKPKKQSLLSKTLNLEKEIKNKIRTRTLLETQSKSFESLTPEQIKAILSYMDQVANCIVIGEQLSKAIHSSIAISQDYYGNKSIEERNVHQRMLQKVTEQSDFTMEEIESILERVKQTIDENNVRYGRYTRLSDKSYTTYPTSPESMYAAKYFEKFYKSQTKTKK